MNIGDRVKQLREQKGMTQQELATRLGYRSKSSVTHIENGRDIPRSMVVSLADILDTTPAYLMGWEGQKNNAPDNIRDVVKSKIDGLSDQQLDRLLGYLEALSEE